MHKILIAEDDRDIVKVLELYLNNNGFETVVASDGEKAVEIIENDDISLALLDIMMPKKDGYAVAEYIRENRPGIPVIFLTAKNDPSEVVLGLDIGADDYVTKPFNPLEVIARIKSTIRRCKILKDPSGEGGNVITAGNIALDKDKMEVRRGEERIPLTVTEYKVLYCLMREPGKVFTKKQICSFVYGGDYLETDDNSLTVHISKIRSKLETDSSEPEYIKNIRGLGYKFEKR